MIVIESEPVLGYTFSSVFLIVFAFQCRQRPRELWPFNTLKRRRFRTHSCKTLSLSKVKQWDGWTAHLIRAEKEARRRENFRRNPKIDFFKLQWHSHTNSATRATCQQMLEMNVLTTNWTSHKICSSSMDHE